MERKKANDYPQELWHLIENLNHGFITRREFFERASRYAVGGMTVAALLETLQPNYALGQQIPANDSRIKAERDRLIGGISLMTAAPENRGFWLGLPWQGQGLMTEACEVATNYWFESLKFPVLRVSKAVANTASRRISEKQGMRLVAVEERDYVCGRLPGETWEITADEWRRRRATT